MRPTGIPLLALLPIVTFDVQPPCAPPAASLAVDVHVQATTAWGRLNWRFGSETAEAAPAPGSLVLCWSETPGTCDGLELRVDVFVADEEHARPRAQLASSVRGVESQQPSRTGAVAEARRNVRVRQPSPGAGRAPCRLPRAG